LEQIILRVGTATASAPCSRQRYNFSLLLAALLRQNPAMAELMYAAHSRLKSKFFTGDA